MSLFSKTGVKVKVIRLSGGKDPDEIIKKFGKDRMRQILTSAVGDTEFELMRAMQGFDISSADGKVAYLERAVDILSHINNAIQWDVYASKLSAQLDVDKTAIVVQIEKKAKQRAKRETREQFSKAATFNDEAMKKANPERQKNLIAAKAEEILIASLLHNPDFYAKIKDSVSDDDFTQVGVCRSLRCCFRQHFVHRIFRSHNLCAIFHNGVALVDGNCLVFGIISNKCLAKQRIERSVSIQSQINFGSLLHGTVFFESVILLPESTRSLASALCLTVQSYSEHKK